VEYRQENPMEEPRKELLMQVDGMTCQGCVDTVKTTVRRLDPDAEVDVDLDHGRVRVLTTAQSVEVAEAISKAGYEAYAMTG
jgi:copper chaperone